MQLERLGLDYEIRTGVIGANLTDDEVAQSCDQGFMQRHKSWFTRGMLGATLTCHAVYTLIRDRRLPCALYAGGRCHPAH